MSERVKATKAAIETIRRLQAEHGPIALFQSGGCCDGSSPMCLTQSEMPPGPNDVLLGEIDGVPVYIDAEQDTRWHEPALLIDIAPGASDSFSLEGPDELHFVTRLPGQRG
jgi:hypothetical protein